MVTLYVTHGDFLSYFLYHDTLDAGMDFFHSIEYVRGRQPYAVFDTLYPPLANLFFYALFLLVPASVSDNWTYDFEASVAMRGTETDLRTTQSCFLLYVFFVVLAVLLLAVLLRDVMQNAQWARASTFFALFSFGVLNAVDRGNIILLAAGLSLFFVMYHRSKRAWVRELALVALAVAAYAIQIYMDFSGYSDMAIGCAKCMGYELPVNFNLPYISHNVSEFWKRWHISLSSWLMQYLYIPLGGNRKGRIRTYVNLMITMLLGGLWHGAEWSFVLWGGLHGLALCIHKGFRKLAGYQKGQERKKNVLVDTLSILGTDIFVCICWIFFRAENVPKAWLVLKQLFGFRAGITHPYSFAIAAIIILCIATVAAYLRAAKKKEKTVNGFYPVMDLNHFWSLVIFFVEIGLILGLAYVKGSPFIYFQF